MAYANLRDPERGSVGDALDWPEPPEAGRDWKKVVLIAGLGVLSWVATYVGMLELIEANMGELPLVHKIIVAFSVAMLMTMIIWLLDQLFAPLPLFTKLVYAVGYVFLSVISVGFGFGFYWKVLESRSEATRSAESAVGQVQTALHAASTRLDQLKATLDQLAVLSTQKAEMERASGTSCPASRPGDGPRRALREADAQRFSFAAEMVKNRVGSVNAEMSGLDADFARLTLADPSTIDARTGTRNEFLKGLGRKLDLTVAGFNAFRTDPQLKQLRTDLADRAEKTTFTDTKGGTFSCPDPQLQTALRGVVRAIDQLPELEKPKIAAVEGAEATIEAFRRLTATFQGALTLRMPPSAEELRALQQKAVQSVEQSAPRQPVLAEQPGLSKRDYVPLAVAVFVDLCLLLVSMGRPMNRLHGLVPKMRAAERGPVYQILSKFSDIHGDPDTRQKFEVFRHVVFDYLDTYYVAVPLEAPRFRLVERYETERTPFGGYREVLRAWREQIPDGERERLQEQAHLLANLFSSFEREGIFHRIDSRFLGKLTRTEPTTEVARVRLRRQGSKFAESTAFRIYRFESGAWPEIILGAVMGAARRVQTEKRAQRLERMVKGLDALELPSEPAERPGMRSRGRDATLEAPRPTAPEPDVERVAAFGRYARFLDDPPAEPPRSANNNTGPSRDPAARRARPLNEAAARSADNVVPMPRPVNAAPPAAADKPSSPDAGEPEAPVADEAGTGRGPVTGDVRGGTGAHDAERVAGAAPQSDIGAAVEAIAAALGTDATLRKTEDQTSDGENLPDLSVHQPPNRVA